MFRRFFCNHKWEKVSESTHESPFEKAAKHASEFRYRSDHLIGKHIVIVKCDKCGKIKKFVTEI